MPWRVEKKQASTKRHPRTEGGEENVCPRFSCFKKHASKTSENKIFHMLFFFFFGDSPLIIPAGRWPLAAFRRFSEQAPARSSSVFFLPARPVTYHLASLPGRTSTAIVSIHQINQRTHVTQRDQRRSCHSWSHRRPTRDEYQEKRGNKGSVCVTEAGRAGPSRKNKYFYQLVRERRTEIRERERGEGGRDIIHTTTRK